MKKLVNLVALVMEECIKAAAAYGNARIGSK